MDQLHHVALQVQNIIVCLETRSVCRVFEREWFPGFIIDEIKDCCQGVIRFNCLSGNFSVQCKILMRDRLRSGDMSSLRGNSFIFSRSVCFDRLILDRLASPAGHDLAGAGRLRWDDNAAVVLQRYKDQREQEFCLIQEVTSFLRGWGPAKDETFIFSRSFPFWVLFKLHTI